MTAYRQVDMAKVVDQLTISLRKTDFTSQSFKY